MSQTVKLMSDNPSLGTVGQPTEIPLGTSTNPIYTAAGTPSVNSPAKAEDAAHASGDIAEAVVFVRNDTGQALTSTDLDYGTPTVDNAGRQITKNFAAAAADWGSGPITITAVNQALKAAGAGAIRNFMTGYVITTGATWTANTLQFQDGTTVKFEVDLPAGAAVYSFSPLTPLLEGTAATAVNVKATGAVTGTCKVNALGYSGV